MPVAGHRFLLLLSATLLAPPLSAQSPDLRQELTRFRSEISGIQDSSVLREWERRFGGEGGTPSSEAMRRMRRGWVRLRLGELGNPWTPGQAVGDFSGATQREPNWPEAWFALGEARRQEADRLAADPANLGKRVGFGRLEGALEAYQHALRLEPGYTPALHRLYDGAVALRDTTRMMDMILPALRTAASTGTRDPFVWFALGRAERLMGDPHAAVSDFRQYLALGGPAGPGLRDLAWSAYMVDDPVADSAYTAGAELDDSATVAGYREDIALIATDEELARFDAARGFARSAFLETFWRNRDRQALRSEGERIREHFRRLSYAERHFGLEVNRRYYAMDFSGRSSDIFHSGSTRFDDRGIVYVRQGPPDDRVLTVTYGIQPNESWRYARSDGDLMLHFAANVGGDIHDLRLIGTVADIGGVVASNADVAATLFTFLDRCRIYEPYCKYLNWGNEGRAKILREERDIVLSSTSVAVTTDAAERHFAAAIAANARAFAVGTRGPRTLVHIAFQIGLERAPGLAEDSTTFTVPLQVRVNLTDREGRSAGWIDTTTSVLLPGGGGTGSQIDAVGRVAVAMPPGTWHYKVAIAYHDTIGAVLRTDSVTVGNFTAPVSR